jgi:hypothetical protein
MSSFLEYQVKRNLPWAVVITFSGNRNTLWFCQVGRFWFCAFTAYSRIAFAPGSARIDYRRLAGPVGPLFSGGLPVVFPHNSMARSRNKDCQSDDFLRELSRQLADKCYDACR